MGEDWRLDVGDCLDVMPGLEAGSARLIFADPPYNLGVDYGAHHDDRMSPAITSPGPRPG